MAIQLDTCGDLLKEKIKHHYQRLLEARQLSQRLKKLFPSQVKSITQQRRIPDAKKVKGFSRVHLALASEEFIEVVDQLSDIGHEVAFHKVMYETHLMLFNAKQTHASFQKQLRIARLDSRQ